MEFKLGTQRLFGNLLEKAPDNLATALFSDFGISDEVQNNKRITNIIENLGTDINLRDFRILWKQIELLRLFSSWVSVYTIDKQKLKFSDFKKKFQDTQFKSNNHFVMNLSSKGSSRIYLFASLIGNHKGTMEKAAVSNVFRDVVYVLPDKGILLTNLKKDENGNYLKKKLETIFTSKLEPFRIKSMIISKFYRETQIINQLNVSAVFEITGFAGFDEISFKGNHVKQGLYGLHKRQDIRVNLDQIGPNIQASSENLHLKVGPHIMVKTPAGFIELEKLID